MIDEEVGRGLLALASEAAARASELIRSRAPDAPISKGDRDLTSDVDVTVEHLVREFLHDRMPDADFLGEEEGGHITGSEFLWVLDPIDGTINYLHGLPLCAVSLSLSYADTVVAAVVQLPFIGTQYTALRGHGAYERTPVVGPRVMRVRGG